MNLFASRWAATPPAPEQPQAEQPKPRAPSFFDQKPLPPPPQNDDDVPAETPRAEEQDKAKEEKLTGPAVTVSGAQPTVAGADEGADFEQPPIETAKLEPPRMRKRVSWRGKNCVISIPQLDYDALGLVKPMSTSDIQQRIKAFEDAGYDTRGFDLSEGNVRSGDPVHARPIWPDETEMQSQAATKQQHNVKLPNLKLWSDYMDQLTEAKLAALGVSMGNDEPPPPPAQDMSRQSSAQYPPLPFSPPLPTGSSGSMGRPGMVRGHSHTMSMAAPISPLNGPFGHMHRHSTFHGGFPGMAPPQQQQSMEPQRQPSLPTSLPTLNTFNPGQQFGHGHMASVGSPAQLSALRNEFGGIRGSGSPLAQQMFPQSPQEYSRGVMEQQRRQHGYSQSVQQAPMPSMIMQHQQQQQQHRGSMGPSPLLPELPEDEDEEELSDPQPYRPPQKRTSFQQDIAIAEPKPWGHRHNISEGLEREVMEAEQRRQSNAFQAPIGPGRLQELQPQTNGLPEAPKEVEQPAPKEPEQSVSDPNVQQGPRGHKKSASRFNVEAPAFTFNPGATFQPGAPAFEFGKKPQENTNEAPAGHARQKSSGTFNVAAPAFKPGNLPSSMPKSDFSFSANGPELKPNGPAGGIASMQASAANDKPKIFGNVEISDIVKPTKKSKAIPILKPEEGARDSFSSTDVEDEEGRIGRSDERPKRQRAFPGDDGDQVPKFAEPTPMPPTTPAKAINKNPPKEAPSVEAPHSQSKITPKTVPVVDRIAEEAAKAVDEIAEEGDEIVEDVTGKENVPPPSAQKPSHTQGHQSNSSLSASAKPFVFRPAQNARDGSQSPTPQKPMHQRFPSVSSLEDGEIREDGPPDASPIRPLDMASENTSERGSTPSLAEPLKPFQFPHGKAQQAHHHTEPSFDEIDAIMQQMNEAEAEADTRPNDIAPRVPTPDFHPQAGVTYLLPEWPRDDARSPTPRLQTPFRNADESSFTVHEQADSGEHPPVSEWPHIKRLNKADDVPHSDWSGLLSSPEEDKLHQRSLFFDNHIDNVIGRAVERRLQPLESSLRAMQSTVNKRRKSIDHGSPYKGKSSSAVQSDADDEDEPSESLRARPISRGKDQKLSQIKAIVQEALREQSPRRSQSSYDIADLHSALADMKVSFARAASASLELEDVRVVVEEVMGRHSQALVAASQETERPEKHQRHVSELEGRLNETLAGALEEANHRHQVEEREAEVRRMLKLAEEELSILRDTGRDDDGRVHELERERHELHRRAEDAEDAQQRAEERVRNIEAENEAMQATLEEYRMSSSKWREEIDDGKIERDDLQNTIAGLETQVQAVQESGKRDREELENTIAALQRQFEESQDSGSGMRRRLEKLHSDMATAAGQLATEKASWRAREEDYRDRCEILEAQNAMHAREKAQLEEENHSLRATATEASEARLAVDHMRSSHTSLDDLVRKLQADLAEQQVLTARYERDFHDARESGRAEIHRTRMSMETDIEAANHQVNMVRVELESELSRVRVELDNVRLEADTAKERHALLLEEEADGRREALRKVNHANSVALNDARHKYEAAIKDLTAQHSRVLHHAVEDKERSEYFLNERLMLSDAKLQHFQDRVLHLEERLDVTKSAAQAAAMSAKSKAASAPQIPVTKSTSGRDTGIPEKVSPQALRESILVLQEQLQERETRIEQQQQQLRNEGPAKVKERDTEIAWLRELLSVRNEDLTDLVNTLSRPTFDRDAVRDIAIRIRANLQMEQQEKERFGQNANKSPGQALASLSSFATPKAAQLTSAFNKWRTNMESSALKSRTPSSAAVLRAHTPSRPTSSARAPPSYKSGLMTPPATNLRSSPGPEASPSGQAPRLSRQGYRPEEINLVDGEEDDSNRNEMPHDGGLDTPPIFHKDGYDQDAEDTHAQMSNFGDDGGEGDEDLDIEDNEPPAFRSLEQELEDGEAEA